MSTISIHQPGYLPWLGFFDKIARSDVFVLLDDVQFEKNYFDNRNKIKIVDGWGWLTVPVKYKFGDKLNEVKIDNNQRWAEKHYKALSMNYNKSRYFPEYCQFFKEFYEGNWEKLIDLNVAFINFAVEKLGMKKEIIKSSELDIKEEKSERLLNICKKLKADVYLSGRFGKNYLNEKDFEENNIKVVYQDFKHPAYPQLYGNFIPELSVVDLLLNCGQESLNIILNDKK
jgi:hypothetical protein